MNQSSVLFGKAQQVIPGGVNSPVRAFKSVDMTPIYMKKGKGALIYDEDGNTYIDYVGSWGPLILGHADDRIIEVIKKQAELGTSFGTNTQIEIQLAQLITSIYPSIEKIRMVSSGTEATMSAVRLARGYTGKNKIIKFEGCYHGHGDSFLIKAGSGVLTLSIPGTPGVTPGTASDTLVGEYNNIESVKALIASNKNEIAAVIIEPIMGNAGVVLPHQEFLQQLRELTLAHGILLIFDEVITGFRVALGGAQSLYGITPDLTCLGKIIGGGLPVGAFGGKKEIMDYLAPNGPVYQAGTLSGNPLAMAVGLETLTILSEPTTYASLEEKAIWLEEGMKENLKKIGIPYCLTRVGSMSCLFFTSQQVIDFSSAMTANTGLYTTYFKEMIAQGIYIAPSQFEASFISLAHTQEHINQTLAAQYKSLKALK